MTKDNIETVLNTLSEECPDPNCAACTWLKLQYKLEQVGAKLDYAIPRQYYEQAYHAIYNLSLAN